MSNNSGEKMAVSKASLSYVDDETGIRLRKDI